MDSTLNVYGSDYYRSIAYSIVDQRVLSNIFLTIRSAIFFDFLHLLFGAL